MSDFDSDFGGTFDASDYKPQAFALIQPGPYRTHIISADKRFNKDKENVWFFILNHEILDEGPYHHRRVGQLLSLGSDNPEHKEWAQNDLKKLIHAISNQRGGSLSIEKKEDLIGFEVIANVVVKADSKTGELRNNVKNCKPVPDMGVMGQRPQPQGQGQTAPQNGSTPPAFQNPPAFPKPPGFAGTPNGLKSWQQVAKKAG
jgi:hypothetical protein